MKKSSLLKNFLNKNLNKKTIDKSNSTSNNHIFLVSPDGIKKEVFFLDGCQFTICGENNIIEIYEPIGLFLGAKIFINGCNNTKTIIKQQCCLRGCYIDFFNGNNQKLIIGEKTHCGGLIIKMHENSSINIGSHCMFSENIVIWGADGHI